MNHIKLLSSLGREIVKNVPLVDSIPALRACIIDAMAVSNRIMIMIGTGQASEG